MREIKFRAWDENKKNFIGYAEYVVYPNSGEVAEMVSYDAQSDKLSVNHEAVLEQYTGLYDKNGKEIYEGDIVEVTIVSDVYATAKGTPLWATKKEINPVVINPGIVTVGDRILCNYKSDQIEVIGNIHENKELLDD